MFFAGSELPKKVTKDGKIDSKQAQLAYGQISSNFQKHGDTIRSVEYNSLELDAHYESIKKGPEPWHLKFNLWLNKESSDFNRDWWRAVKFSILVGMTFFYLVTLLSDNYRFTCESIYDLLPAYIKFMNPLRFFELKDVYIGTEAENIKLWKISYLIDFIGRLAITYGYYQTIQSFRRLGRK